MYILYVRARGRFLPTSFFSAVYVLAYVYSPTSTQTRDHANHLLKDNPAFSMINESDDETEAMLVKVEEEEDEAAGEDAAGDEDDNAEVDTEAAAASLMSRGRGRRAKIGSSDKSVKDDARALLLGQDD